MYFGNGRLPFGDGAKVVIEEGKIEGAVAVGGPGDVDVRTASEVEYLRLVSDNLCTVYASMHRP